MHKFTYEKNLLDSSNSDLNLEYWRVKVESTWRKVKKIETMRSFLDIFLDLESINDR